MIILSILLTINFSSSCMSNVSTSYMQYTYTEQINFKYNKCYWEWIPLLHVVYRLGFRQDYTRAIFAFIDFLRENSHIFIKSTETMKTLLGYSPKLCFPTRSFKLAIHFMWFLSYGNKWGLILEYNNTTIYSECIKFINNEEKYKCLLQSFFKCICPVFIICHILI